MPYPKLKEIVEDPETNAMANVLVEAQTRLYNDVTEQDLKDLASNIPLLMRCMHDFGYRLVSYRKENASPVVGH